MRDSYRIETYRNSRGIDIQQMVSIFVICCLVALSFRVGYRDRSIGTDYSRYYSHYQEVMRERTPTRIFEPGYESLELLAAWVGISAEVFFSVVALLYVFMLITAYWHLAKMAFSEGVKRNIVLFCSVVIMVWWPFFWNGLTNVVRQGLATPVLLMGLSMLYRRHWGKALLAFAVATSLHVSSLVFSMVSIVLFVVRKRVLHLVALFSILYILKLSDKVAFVMERLTRIPIYSTVMSYGSGAEYRTGFRYDFLVFSTMPLIIWWLGCWLRPTLCKKTMSVARIYGSLLVPFLLLGYGAFMDRWLLPAWIMMPVFMVATFVSLVRGTRILLLLSAVTVACSVLLVVLLRPTPF